MTQRRRLSRAQVAATPGRDTSGHVLIRVEPDVRWCTAEEMAEAERRAVERTGRVLVAWLIGRWMR